MDELKILNLTQHPATPAQLKAGVVDLPKAELTELKKLLDFPSLPALGEIWAKAIGITAIAKSVGAKSVMIGGAPYLMASLENNLRAEGITPCYAFSKRESVETTSAAGEVVKTSIFVHGGFILPPYNI
ncbi:MAG: hypothetical protein [Podoviridae sp. cty5g4]|nr:MAG: hypothetical protein [Podoviridae sp. cty5g4]